MTVVARRFASTPNRTSAETWEAILSIISKNGAEARSELESISGFAASTIADEIPKDAPIVLCGNGPLLRIYCLYGEDAVIGDDCDESALSWNPTDGDWRLFLPFTAGDLQWISNALQKKSTRIFAYEAGKEPIEPDDGERAGRTEFTIDMKEFFKK
jgi:hypothetical protein